MFGAVDSDGFQVDEGNDPPAAATAAAVTPVASAEKPAERSSTEQRPRNTDGTFAATRENPEPAENVEGDDKPAAAAKPADTAAAKPAEKAEPKPGEKVEAKPGDKPAQRSKPRNDPEARIGQALERARLAEERAVRAEERARLFEEGRVKPAERQAARPVDDDPEPRWEDYAGTANEAKFIDDKIAHGVRQALKQQAAQSQQQQQRSYTTQRHQEREKAYIGRLDAAIKADPDFLNNLSQDVADLMPTHRLPVDEHGRPKGRTVWNAIADEIVDSEHAPLLLVHLSDNPDELQRLATLQPRELTRQMAKLEARLAADAAPAPATAQPAQISQARPPVRPVEGAAPVAADPYNLDDDSISDDEYRRRYNAAEKARRKAARG